MRAVIRNSADLSRFVTQVVPKLDGKPYTVTVKRFHRPRSLDQNAKAHAMIRELAEHTGHSDGEMKELVKAMFLPLVTVTIGNHEVVRPKGTSELAVTEMMDFIERLYELGHEVGCVFQSDG